MTAILPILIICVILFAIYRMRFFHLDGLPAWASPVFFLIKLVFGFALWALYTFYYKDRYTADIYKFYDDAHYIHQAWVENKSAFVGLMTGSDDSSLDVYTSHMLNWERNFSNSTPSNENRLMIRLNAAMMLISGENMHVHTVLFCFISFLGCILLLKVFQSFLPPGKKRLALLTVLLPSFLFWTSGGLKESIIILGLSLLLYGFIFFPQRKIISALSFLLGIMVLLLIKYFFLLCLLPALTGYYLFAKKQSAGAVVLKYISILVLSLVLMAVIAPLSRKLDFARIISKKQKHAMDESRYVNAGSYFESSLADQDMSTIIRLLPRGLWVSLGRPYPWEDHNTIMVFSTIENIAVLLFLLFALISHERKETLDYNVILFMIVAVATYFSLIGIMTFNFGSLIRYRVVVLPLLIFVGVYIMDEKRLPFMKR